MGGIILIAKDIKWKIQTEDFKQTLAIDFATNIDNQNMREIEKAQELLNLGKKVEVSIKEYKKKRSLDANAMLWVIMNEIAEKVGTTKDEIYIQMLDRYGVFTHIVVKPEVVDKVKQEWKITRELGEVVINGKTGIQLQCYFGSSSYNSKEFSTLLEGVIYEAKELDIETITPKEKEELLRKWENK